jgi:hypothetical protein
VEIAANVEIHFHQQEQASVFLETNSSGDAQRLGEIGLLSMFSLRMLGNLGENSVSDSLAMLLTHADEAILQAAYSPGKGAVQIITYPGVRGRKEFSAWVRLRSDAIGFDMSYKGFGWLGIGLGYYAPTAVAVLLRYLAEKRADDAQFLASLGATAVACGNLQASRRITLTNQAQLCMWAMAKTCGHYLDVMTQEEKAAAQK